MGLSSDLVAQFVKITNDNKPNTKKETTVYGTTVEYKGSIYVKIDGSDLLTPVMATANTKPGERVTVMIKNHTATVTGNLSSPAARLGDLDRYEDIADVITEFEIVIANKVDTEELNAEVARIDELRSDTITVKEKLTAAEADIDNLQASSLTVTGKLTAAEADIDHLQSSKIDVTIADAKYATIANLDATNADINALEATYADFTVATADRFTAMDAKIDNLAVGEFDAVYANIDFSNIGTAAIQTFFSKSGIIEDVIVGDGTVTGRLVGVTIAGDLIEGNTVVAEKLVIKGEDGLYYKLNTDGVSASTEQTDYNSLNGSIIRAKSVTAEKVSVSDLVAFDATLAGLHMTDGTLYSGAKASVHNASIGFFLDKHGQFSVGDGNNFIKYYTGSDNVRRLEIAADSLIFGASRKSVEATVNEVNAKNGEGGNLLLNGKPSSASNWGLSHNVTYVDGYFSVPAFTPSTTGGHGDTISQGFADRIPFAGYERKFKVSFDIRDASDGNGTGHIAVWMRWKNANGDQSWPAVDVELSEIASEWERRSGIVTVPTDCMVDAFGIGLYTTSAFDIRSLFIEEVTDLAETQDTLDVTSEAVDKAVERLSSAESLIAQLSNSIAMLVTDGNGTSLMTQTEDGWMFSTAEIQASVNRIAEDLGSLASEAGGTKNAVEVLKQAVDDLGEIAEYVKIGTYEDEPCIELGEGDSDFKLRITNTQIMFMEGTNVPAYFTNQSMHIKKAVIEDELQQGGFVWKARSNGNLGLVWKGVTE